MISSHGMKNNELQEAIEWNQRIYIALSHAKKI